MIVAIVGLGRLFRMRGRRLIVQVAMDDRRMSPCRIRRVQMLCRQRAQERERQQARGRRDSAEPGAGEQDIQYGACEFRKSTSRRPSAWTGIDGTLAARIEPEAVDYRVREAGWDAAIRKRVIELVDELMRQTLTR